MAWGGRVNGKAHPCITSRLSDRPIAPREDLNSLQDPTEEDLKRVALKHGRQVEFVRACLEARKAVARA